MTSNLPPSVAAGMLTPKGRKSETEKMAERAADHQERPDDTPAESSKELLERAAENNDRGSKR